MSPRSFSSCEEKESPAGDESYGRQTMRELAKNSSTHPNLENMDQMIVKNFKGLPLAAKAIGSLLFSKLEEEEWKSILRTKIWELPVDKNILPALSLSYKHLPSHLKYCFVFCSIFHKDFIFDKDRLVKTWMVLGFIQPPRGKQMMDIRSNYFELR
ncbi:hypothetical protein BHE74_00037498 [Ensete ventricosum]|nr:hypothetical protein BHE74_00037498 [Ensete ventricosum]